MHGIQRVDFYLVRGRKPSAGYSFTYPTWVITMIMAQAKEVDQGALQYSELRYHLGLKTPCLAYSKIAISVKGSKIPRRTAHMSEKVYISYGSGDRRLI